MATWQKWVILIWFTLLIVSFVSWWPAWSSTEWMEKASKVTFGMLGVTVLVAVPLGCYFVLFKL